jgi:hypothetical protein
MTDASDDFVAPSGDAPSAAAASLSREVSLSEMVELACAAYSKMSKHERLLHDEAQRKSLMRSFVSEELTKTVVIPPAAARDHVTPTGLEPDPNSSSGYRIAPASVPPNPSPVAWRELHPKIADHQFLLTKGVSIDENGFLHLDRVAMTAIWKMLLDLQTAAHDLHPSEVEELVARLRAQKKATQFNAGGELETYRTEPSPLDLEAASALTSLSQENERLKASITDYEEVLADKRRLAREIDVALCGEEDAAPQASWCDLVKVAEMKRAEITSLSLRVKELEEALSKIEGGWIDEDIPEDDPHDQFSAALQRIARAVLPESAIRRARTVLHGEGE